jgi:putative transposase
VLTGAVEARLKKLLAEKAATMNVQIEALEVMPDHVHLFVAAPPSAGQVSEETIKQYIASQQERS